jgi:hypothetical protein
MFAIHKYKNSESWSTVLRGPPRLNFSDEQTLISDGFSKYKVFFVTDSARCL